MTRHLIFTVLLALTACSPRSAIIVITNDSPENQPVTVRMTKPVDNSFSFIGCDTITVENSIEILENGPDAGSLEALAAMFKGKKVYVDVWATWCAPCKEEFKYASHLHGILTEMGYETLYISIDEERNDERWREMIKGFGLKGKHIRADHRLMDDLYRIYGSRSMAIPWNMILDEEGHIKEKFAKRPSEILPEDL